MFGIDVMSNVFVCTIEVVCRWSSAKRYVCSLVLLLVGGLGLSIGVDRVLPGWFDGNLISGIKDDGDKAVFLGGCREFVSSTCGTLTEVFDDDVWFDFCGVVLPLTDCGDVADQRELLGGCVMAISVMAVLENALEQN